MKLKILFSIFLVLMLTMSISLVSASEITDNQNADALMDMDDASDSNICLNSKVSDDLILESNEDIETITGENIQTEAKENIQSEAEKNIQGETKENIQSDAEDDILKITEEIESLSANSKKDNYIRVYGGQYKEGSNATLEICLLDKEDYYNEESMLSHEIKNVTVTVGSYIYHFDIPAGLYEEDGYFLELGNSLASGNYTVTIKIPENNYYNEQTFTFKNEIRIISESNKADIDIDPWDIYPSGTFKGINGTVKFDLYGIEDAELTGDVKVTLSNSKTTKTYIGTINGEGMVIVNVGYDLSPGEYTVKVQYLGNSLYNPTKTASAHYKFTVYDSSNKIPVDDVGIKISNTVKGQNGSIKLDVSEYKAANISMAGKAVITLKNGKTVYKTYTVNIDKDGLATLTLGSDLAAGNYSVTAKYYGNSYYKAHTTSYGTFYIYSKSNKILIKNVYFETQDTGKGTDGYIEIDLSNKKKFGLSMAGTLTFTLTKSKTVKTYTMNIDENGYGKKKIGGDLAAGEYKINIVKYDTTFYTMAPVELYSFNVYSKDYKVPVYDVYVDTFATFKGQNGTIKIDMSSYKIPGLSMAGTANVVLNKVTYKVKIDKNGIGSIKLGDKLNAGTYTAKIQYLGNSYYKKSYNDGFYFKVYDKNHKITVGEYGEYDYYITVSNAALNHNATLLYNLSEFKINNIGMAGNVSITVSSADGVEYNYKSTLDNNGILSFLFGDNLPVGNYTIDKIKYSGNDYYAKFIVTNADCFQICSEDNKADIGNIYGMEYSGKLSSATIKEGQNTTLSLDFSKYKVEGLSMETNIKIRLTNKASKQKYDYTCALNENGTGTLILGDELAVGNYSIKVLPFENDYYISEFTRDIYKNYDELYLKVDLKNKVETSITFANAKGKADPNYALFKFTLKDAKGNKLIGKTVVVKFNGKTYYTVTDENGKVSFKAYAKAAKKYPIYVTFKGDDTYMLKAIEGNVKISKNKVKFSKATKKVKRSSAKRKFKITLKTSNKKALKAKKVYLKIKGKTYKAKTNKKGVATFKVKLPRVKKTYKYKVTFKGDKGNYKKTYRGKLKVC